MEKLHRRCRTLTLGTQVWFLSFVSMFGSITEEAFCTFDRYYKNKTIYWFLERRSEAGNTFPREKNRAAESLHALNNMKEWSLGGFPSLVFSLPASLRRKNKGKLFQLESLQPPFPIFSSIQVTSFLSTPDVSAKYL